MKIDKFKRAKGPFLYTTEGKKYYDLRQNSNILGHSLKNITTEVKNCLSSCWNVNMVNTTAHQRLEKELSQISPSSYMVRTASSLEEFFARLFLNNPGKCLINNENLKEWLKARRIPLKGESNEQCRLNIYDMAADYLSENIFRPTKSENSLNILNYYWYPELNFNLDSFGDAIIMPELYCGNFKFIIILVKKEHETLLEATDSLLSIQSLQVNSALKQYYTLKKAKPGLFPEKLKHELQIKGRIIGYKETFNREKVLETARKFAELGVLLNSEPPYYSYLPQNLTENQYNFLKRVLT